MQPKAGGKLHPKLNSGTRPIANKYREGKVKSTLKRESKRPRNRWEGSARQRAVSAVELSMACLHHGCRGARAGVSPRPRSVERRVRESCGAACALSARTRQRRSPRAPRTAGQVIRRDFGLAGSLQPVVSAEVAARASIEVCSERCSPERLGWQRGAFALPSAQRRRWRRVAAVRPVLKHGPRSAGGARVFG